MVTSSMLVIASIETAGKIGGRNLTSEMSYDLFSALFQRSQD